MQGMIIQWIIKWLESQITEELIDKFKCIAVDYLRELAQKSENQIDDQIVEIIADAIGCPK